MLERELGVQLLHRSTRSLTPTEAGAALLQEGRALLEQAQRLAERTRDRAAQLTGVFRLTSAEDMAGWVAPLIAEYVRLHPGVHVEYRPSDRLLDLVAEGMDLSLRTTGRRDSSLRAVNLAVFDVWCVASPAYRRRGERHGASPTGRPRVDRLHADSASLDAPDPRRQGIGAHAAQTQHVEHGGRPRAGAGGCGGVRGAPLRAGNRGRGRPARAGAAHRQAAAGHAVCGSAGARRAAAQDAGLHRTGEGAVAAIAATIPA
ncbi:hypothetical protein HK414_06685 [Ramlibacter terrae]|uniref:HTH lysR-type domain-containing protein n=1 Tax=Ramlibacter terrae TaxID=2732511 RepID=A0ABX6P166_9BURK|nr:hypothetical protein HK414_06685 [Ramlibacter terrae]